MPRNRQQTEARIREAARKLLREHGFEAWGVNGIARAAGVDKVLIYRYFDSTEGLLEAIVQEIPFWPDPDRLPDRHPEAFLDATLESLEAFPEAGCLLSHPSARKPVSPIRRKAEADLERWLEGLRERTRGAISTDLLEGLAAILFFQAMTGKQIQSGHDLWTQVSPPLEWATDTQWEANEELPTELL